MGLRLIAYTCDIIDNTVIIKNSEGDFVVSNDPAELLDFIGEDFTDEERTEPYRELKVAWDIDQLAALILKLLPLSRVREIASPKHESGDIFYIPSKVLGVNVDGHKSYIYHLIQYYDDEPPPDDAFTLHAKASEVVDAFKQMGLNPYKLTSPISVYESSVLNHMEIPNILDLPNKKEFDELIEWAETGIHKDWLENFAVGHWHSDECWDYDLQSSYGFTLSQLKSIKYAKFAKSRYFCPDADWGLVKGRIKINEGVKLSPLVYTKNGRSCCPANGSTWEDIFDINDIRFVLDNKIGDFKPYEGWYCKYTAPGQPFEVPLSRIFDLRHKGGMVKKLAKRIGAAAWGKLIFKAADGKVNQHYNPIMAEQVVTDSRLRVAQFIYQHNLQEHVIHIGIDGVLTDKKVTGLKDIVKMGEWKQSTQKDTLVISPGRVYTNEKKPGGLYYGDIMQMINDKPRESFYSANLKRRMTLTEAVELGDLSKLGTMIQTHSSVDLNLLRTGQNREFKDFPRTGKDLIDKKYYSEPVVINE